ncbi:MAG: hypothetical protein ABJC89_06965 [Acidobacteriota bacterium]
MNAIEIELRLRQQVFQTALAGWNRVCTEHQRPDAFRPRHMNAGPARKNARQSGTLTPGPTNSYVCILETHCMKANRELLDKLKGISSHLHDLSDRPEDHDLDVDAIVDLNLARESVDKLINRVERVLE